MSLFAGTTVTASAADGASVITRTIPLDVTTSNITDTNGNPITPSTDTNGDSIYNCKAEGWSYRLNQDKQIYELTLSGVNFDIKNTNPRWAIMVPGKVILADGTENRVSTVSSDKLVAAINTPEITGSGSLTVSATSTLTESGASCYGIYSMKDLTLNQCSIVVDGVKCSSGSATGIFAAYSKTLTIKANTAKNNTITIKNVQGKTTKALGAQKPIVADGAFVSGAKEAFTGGTTKIINFKDPSTPVIVSFTEPQTEPEAAVFTDGFGNSIAEASTYVKGTTTNDKGYTFAGWFNGETELENTDAAVAGTTYTAKWTKNGKTVRTTALDLRDQTEDCSNAAEGWSWNAATKTLTFSGATIDIPESNTGAIIAVCLPEGATVKSDANTQNTICNRSKAGEGAIGLMGMGALTIDGSGELSITGKVGGILSMGALTINAPLATTITGERGMAVSASKTITLDSSVSIKTPVGGKVCTDKGAFIGDSNGTHAKNVVIAAASPSTVTLLNNGYPYSKDVSDQKITLVIDAKNASTYQWQIADSKNSEFKDITDAASNTYTFVPENQKWYRCIVDGTASKSVMAVRANGDNRSWTKPFDGGSNSSGSNCWYIGNGTMAYMVADSSVYTNGPAFDVTGLYTKDNKEYMLQTVQGGQGWHLYSTTSAEPEAEDFSDSSSASLDALRVSFDENSANAVIFEADLAENQQAFSFGADSCLGNFATSDKYNDYAVLNAVLEDNALKQIDLIGAKTVGEAADNDPAFVITPLNPVNKFWIGYYFNRQTYAYNTSKREEGATFTDIGLGEVVTKLEGVDSGITMSWLNVASGGSVKFKFSVGSVTDTGVDRGEEVVGSVTAVTVSPNTEVSVNKGGTQQFAATVSGTGTFDNTVTWKIENANSSNTTISDSGLLTVGADETASSISVIATSKGDSTKSCTVSVKIPQAATTYTVQFNTNGGSAVGSATVSEGGKLTAPKAPTKDGYTFHGWYKDAAFTNSWNFDVDTVTGNTTLYAKWAETAKLYGISGTVYASDGTTTASGVSVKLMKGDKQVASATSDSNGAYSFTGVAPGVYNIVAEKDDTTQTTLVIVANHNETGKNVTLPQSKVNSKLTVNGADTPDVVAGGLDKEAAAVKGENDTATSVKVEMTVESKSDTEVNSTDKTNIETSASGKTLEYLDIKVTKTVDGTESAITTTANMMEIIIPYDMTGKSNITVYRNHGDSATAFTQLSTRPESGAADGTYYLDTVNHLIYVYTQNFSTYAIGYNMQPGGGSGSGGSSSGGSSSSSGGSSSGNSSTISTPSAKNGTVSVSPKSASKGTTVTVTVTPDKGYVLETLTATDASGKKLDLKNLGSGKYSFTMSASKVEVKATFMEDNTMLNYFVDVPASAYYYDAVLWAAEQGITGGTDATHFSPDGVCTRAQAVTFLWRAAGSPAPSATAMTFTDVAADSYYYNAVLWAMENGITVGTSSTTFSPDLKCSRAHIMTFLWRSEKSPAAGSVDVSADAYYADAVLWAVKESVTNGTSSATFSPDADCTRAQIVTFIWRTLAR